MREILHLKKDLKIFHFIDVGDNLFGFRDCSFSPSVSGSKGRGRREPPILKPLGMTGVTVPSPSGGDQLLPPELGGSQKLHSTSTHLRLIKRSVSPLLTIGQLSDALGRGR